MDNPETWNSFKSMGIKQFSIFRHDNGTGQPGTVLQTLKWSTLLLLAFSMVFSLCVYGLSLGSFDGKDFGALTIVSPYILMFFIIWSAGTEFSLFVGLSASWIIFAIAILADSIAVCFQMNWFRVYFTFVNIAMGQIFLAMISWLLGDFKLRKSNYPFYAFAGSLSLMWLYWDLTIHASFIKDSPVPDSQTWLFLTVSGLVLLLLAPVLRHGTRWERFIATLLCFFPALGLAGLFYFSYLELTQA